MAVIAVAGFHHETNTFAPSKATYDDFVGGGGWPPLARGLAAISVVEGINLGLAGFVTAARAAVTKPARPRLMPSTTLIAARPRASGGQPPPPTKSS